MSNLMCVTFRELLFTFLFVFVIFQKRQLSFMSVLPPSWAHSAVGLSYRVMGILFKSPLGELP